jgi:hypothetical protein
MNDSRRVTGECRVGTTANGNTRVSIEFDRPVSGDDALVAAIRMLTNGAKERGIDVSKSLAATQ